MNRTLSNLIGVALLAVLGIVGWAAWEGGMMAAENRASVKAAAASAKDGVPDVFAESRDVTIAMLRPCKPGPCGLIPGMNATIGAIGSTVTTMQQQVAQTGTLITATAHNLDTVGDSVKQVAGSLSATAAAATGTLNAATDDVIAAKVPIAKMGPLLDAYTATGTHLDALLTNPAIPEMMKNGQAASGDFDEIAFDGRRIADDATKKYFTPLPWYRKALPYVTTAAKISAYALPW